MEVLFLVTVHRRYHELLKNLEALHERCLGELGRPARVWAVWSCPEPARAWFMGRLVRDGLLEGVIRREPLPGDGRATTAVESVNIRRGLLCLAARFPPPDSPCVFVLAADVRVLPGTLPEALAALEGGARACAYHWENGSRVSDVWHTNFLALRLHDAAVWPPVSPEGHPDCLEGQWGDLLRGRSPLFLSHNSGQRRFVHAHESEGLPPFPERRPVVSASLGCVVRAEGALSWLGRGAWWGGV